MKSVVPVTGCSTGSNRRRHPTCGNRSCSCAGTTGSAGTPAADSGATISSVVRVAHHSASVASSSSSTPRRPTAVASAGSAAQPAASHHPAQRLPLGVVGHGDGDPTILHPVRVDVGGAVHALRDTRGTAVAAPLEEPTVRGVLDDLLGGEVERGTDHRALEVHPAAGAPPVLERQEERDGGVRTAHRVGDARRRLRAPIREATDPGDPGLRFDGRRVGEPLAPGAGDAVRRCAQHDQLRVPRQEDRPGRGRAARARAG